MMEPLRMHLKELLDADVIEGPLPLEDATGLMSNMVIESKKWNPSKIRLTLDIRMMGAFILQTHYPIPTSKQLCHEFAESDRLTILDLNHAFHRMKLDLESQKLFVLRPLWVV